MTNWIHKINSPDDLKKVPLEKLPEVAEEYRQFLIESVAKTGGHLGASLGTLELTMALHYVLNSPTDKICWDVGHQAYVHKMITGRRDQMATLRQPGGLSGFPAPWESCHDPFIVGHAGTAISQAIGLACARDIRKGNEQVVAIVGDGALTAGLSFEALNHAGQLKKNMLIILNDNEMSIAKNVGAVSRYLNKVLTHPLYNKVRGEMEKQLQKFPRLQKLANTSLDSMKHLFVPGVLFEEFGFRYFGPVDGHNVIHLVKILKDILALNTCSLLHVITKKGRGCEYAEQDQEKGHGVAPFNVKTGVKMEGARETNSTHGISFTQAFSDAILKHARRDPSVVAVTAAMLSGTGLTDFQKVFPERCFDVGIAEQHAVTFAGAMARSGLKPVVAVYSTFMQRSHDSIMHDVALQRTGVVLALDRAGIVGADGATHQGIFDMAYLGSVPGIVIGAPKDEFEMEKMLELGLEASVPFVLRYPRANIAKLFDEFPKRSFQTGEGEVMFDGEDVTLLALGSMVEVACKAHALLREKGVSARVVNMRFAKPLDETLILESIRKTRMLFTLEEHVITGGFGAKVLEFLEIRNLRTVALKRLALPNEFIEHGSREKQLDSFGLSPEKVADSVIKELSGQKKREKSAGFGIEPNPR
ncbi:MAG TPA: 1-deoxy-D-xylulose-5-phosphate synthase [Candidatus Omnitrophota bacterium]|nr:1-deoxy-D-xylulose-5-phosphate synthase [Candidatus Omnitrophota bacterium]HQB11476.1 1-deoxy-D-xylulose-5-phosphate synthase [Candidatus Omnitrophota bacterium]